MSDPFDGKSLKQLLTMRQRLDVTIERTRQTEATDLRTRITSIAQSNGFTVNELFGNIKSKKAGSVGAAKYANPDDPSDTWTGRGRKPNWLLHRVAKGAKLNDFAI